MCWSGRDELRAIEEEAELARLAKAYEQEIAEWRIASRRSAEALLPGLLEWHEQHNS